MIIGSLRGKLYGYTRSVDTHTSSDRKLSYAGQSQYELRQEYSFILFSKDFIVTLLLCRVLYAINFTILFFSDFDGFLKKIPHVTFILA